MLKEMRFTLPVFITFLWLLLSCQTEKKEKVETSKKVQVQVIDALDNIDIASSVITWKGSSPRGAHVGTIGLKEGSLVLNNDRIIAGEFLIDITSIKNLDIQNPKKSAKLVAHLSNEDFFDVNTYPTSKFVITSVAASQAGKLAVTGNLTAKDVTKSITIPATLSREGGVTLFKSQIFNIVGSNAHQSSKQDSLLALT